jgi:hypothetical protein
MLELSPWHELRTTSGGASAAIPVATSPMDVTRKQRFGPVPEVSSAIRRFAGLRGRNSVICATLRHSRDTRAKGADSGMRPHGVHDPAASWPTRCKTYSVCKKYPPGAAKRGARFLFTAPLWAAGNGAAAEFFEEMSAGAEAYWLLVRCGRIRMSWGLNVELAAWSG